MKIKGHLLNRETKNIKEIMQIMLESHLSQDFALSNIFDFDDYCQISLDILEISGMLKSMLVAIYSHDNETFSLLKNNIQNTIDRFLGNAKAYNQKNSEELKQNKH